MIADVTGEKPRQIEKRHGAQIDGLTKPQSFERVVGVAFAARDGSDAQSSDAGKGECRRRSEPDAPERLAIVP